MGVARSTRRLAATVGLVLLVGCGSEAPPTPAGVASKAGCVDYKDDPSSELFVLDSGTCDLAGSVRVNTFRDNKSRDAWLGAAKAFGGHFVTGDRWTASGRTADLQAFAKASGGAYS